MGCTPAPGCLQGPDPKFQGPPLTARPRLCAPDLQSSGAQVGPAPTASLSKVKRSRLLRHPLTRSLRPFGWGSTSRPPCTSFWRLHVGSNLPVAPVQPWKGTRLLASQQRRPGSPRSGRSRRKRSSQPGPPGGQGLVGAPWGGRERGLCRPRAGQGGGRPPRHSRSRELATHHLPVRPALPAASSPFLSLGSCPLVPTLPNTQCWDRPRGTGGWGGGRAQDSSSCC